jgi:hypothetical protein
VRKVRAVPWPAIGAPQQRVSGLRKRVKPVRELRGYRDRYGAGLFLTAALVALNARFTRSIVADLSPFAAILEARLSAEYFDVMTATSGEEALAVCNRAECDLVLLEVMMPDVDGFEV